MNTPFCRYHGVKIYVDVPCSAYLAFDTKKDKACSNCKWAQEEKQ